MGQFAELIRAVPGFLTKAWLHNDAVSGGFYLFTDHAAARAYIDGPVVASLHANPAFTNVEIHTFDVDADLSARTGIRAAASARRPQQDRETRMPMIPPGPDCRSALTRPRCGMCSGTSRPAWS